MNSGTPRSGGCDRRQFLMLLATAMLAPPAVLTAPTTTGRHDAAMRDALWAVLETLLPRTSTPGATDTDTAGFVQLMVAEVLPSPLATAVLDGLAGLDTACRNFDGQPFARLPIARRAEILGWLDGLVLGVGSGPAPGELKSVVTFWCALKQLAVAGHFTGQAAVESQLLFDPIPVRFEAIVPVGPETRVSYTDRTSVPYLPDIPL